MGKLSKLFWRMASGKPSSPAAPPPRGEIPTDDGKD